MTDRPERPDTRDFASWNKERGPSVASIQRAEAERRALEYRKDGWSYQQIADIMQISVTAASKAVKNALKAYREETNEIAEDVIQLTNARLDEMLTPVLARAKGGDLEAVDRVLKIMERQSKMMGLDQAVKTSISIDQGSIPLRGLTDAELAELEAIATRALLSAGQTPEEIENDDYLADAVLTPAFTQDREILVQQLEDGSYGPEGEESADADQD